MLNRTPCVIFFLTIPDKLVITSTKIRTAIHSRAWATVPVTHSTIGPYNSIFIVLIIFQLYVGPNVAALANKKASSICWNWHLR